MSTIVRHKLTDAEVVAICDGLGKLLREANRDGDVLLTVHTLAGHTDVAADFGLVDIVPDGTRTIVIDICGGVRGEQWQEWARHR